MNLPRVRDNEVCLAWRLIDRKSLPVDPNSAQHGPESSAPKLDFNEVWSRTSDTNTTVYFGNFGDVYEDRVRGFFDPFGPIQEIRLFKEKGYAFVR